jgi:hypothetical protein
VPIDKNDVDKFGSYFPWLSLTLSLRGHVLYQCLCASQLRRFSQFESIMSICP